VRAKFIYEKFTADSDPIKDMGIGLYNQIKKHYQKFLDELYELGQRFKENREIDILLYFAVVDSNIKYVKHLLELGANVHAKRINVLDACNDGEILKILKEHIKKEKLKKSISEKFVEDSDPIHDMGIGINKIIKDCIKNIFEKCRLNTHYYYSTYPGLSGWTKAYGPLNYIDVCPLETSSSGENTFVFRFFSDDYITNLRKKTNLINKKEYAKKLLKYARIYNCMKLIDYDEDREYVVVFKIKSEYLQYFKKIQGIYSYRE
jgi:hypothetical protein